MSGEIKELHDKISLLDDKFDGLNTQQALIGQSVTQMAKALDKLVDIRAETLTIMKQCELNTTEHNEIFTRLRKVENQQATCPIIHKALDEEIVDIKDNRIKPLEADRRWVAYTIIGAVLIAVLALVLTNA